MKVKVHFSLRYAKEQLKKKLEREGVLAAVGINNFGIVVRLYKGGDKDKVPKHYYGHGVEVRVVGGITAQD